MEDLLPGPDGFLLSRHDTLHAEHIRLNDFLLVEELRVSTSPFDMAPWRKLPRGALASQIEAVLRRLAWLYEHDAELTNAHVARLRLATLLRVLYRIKTPYKEAQLRSFLDLTTPLLDKITPYGPVEHVSEYLKENDLTPALCLSLRSFQQNLREEMSSSQASLQSLRQQLHMLLWLDEWETLDPARCWSECIRRDFRLFEGVGRVKWRALLKHIRGNAPVRMPTGWAKQAEPLLAGVGLEDFREQIHLWFAPFRCGHPLPLSVAGSYVLKGLIWFCGVARDEDLKDCCLWLLDVKWKQKRNTDKAMMALGQFGITKEDLLARKLIKPDPPSPAPRLIARMREAACRHSDSHIQSDSDGELIVVQGQLHFYRMFRSTGRIERVTDNSVVELNWPAIPDQLRLFLGRQCDRPEQLNFRAFMLMHDAVFSQYFICR